MAVVKNLMVRAGADFSAITKQANKASKSMQEMSQHVSASTKSMSAAFSGLKSILGAVGVAVSLGALISAAKGAREAFVAGEIAEAKLAQVMRNTMGATDAQIQSIKALTAEQQKLGVIGDEVQISAAQQLATYLQYPASINTLLPALNDMVAQQYGLSATAEQAASTAKLFGKAMEGNVTALKKYGYQITEAQEAILKYGTEEQRAATLANVIEASVGGMNEALAQTPSGQIQQLKDALGDVKESFGQAVTTALGAFLPTIWKIVNALAALADLANRVAAAIAAVFGGGAAKSAASSYGSAMGSAADEAEDMNKQVSGAGKAAKEAKRSLAGFDELTLLQDKNTSSSGGGGSGGGTGGGGGGGGSGGGIFNGETPEALKSLQAILEKIKGLIDSLDFGPMKDSLSGLSAALGHLGDVIIKGLGWAFDHILTPLAHWTVERAVPAVIDTLAAAFDLLASGLEALAPVAEWIWSNWLAPIARWTGDVFIDALNAITDIFKTLTALISGDITFEEFVDRAKDAFSSLRNWIRDKINDIKGYFNFQWSLPDLKLPHIVVGSYIEVPVLGTIPDPRTMRVDWYAKGGIVDGATLIGAGERGAEAILPLESNTGWMDALADRLAERIGLLEFGGDFDFYLDGKLINQYVTIQQRHKAKAKG